LNDMGTDILIVKGLKDSLRNEFGENVREVILFGSRLSEKAGEFSDYDVLIILKQKPDWIEKRKISEICYEIELQNEILIDSHILSVSEVGSLRGKQPVFQKAIREGIHV
jgi:predicted nucleotidyltransferase